MAFKTTVRHQRLSHFVASSALSLAEQVRDLVAAKLKNLLREGEVLPDFKLVQELIGRYLEMRGDSLLGADDRYSSDRTTARDLQLQRREWTRQLRDRLGDARHLINRQFGRERSEALLPQRRFSRLGAAELIRLASQTATILRDPDRNAERQSGFADPLEVAEGLETVAAHLQAVLDQKEGLQARKKQVGLAEKSAELEEVNKAIRSAASLLVGLYTFADLPFHAQRVRQNTNRKGKKPEEENGKAEAATGGNLAVAIAAPREVIVPA